MAYAVDPANGDIVISGFENGIGDSPYSGITDMRSVNPASVSGEAGAGYSTASINAAPVYSSVTVLPVTTTTLFVGTLASGKLIEDHQAVFFTSSTIANISTSAIYWMSGTSQQSSISENFAISTTYGGTIGSATFGVTGTATMSVIPQGLPKYFATGGANNNFMIDAKGQVWSDRTPTAAGSSFNTSGTNSWTYTGNQANSGPSPNTDANGNGLVIYESVTNGTGGTGTPASKDKWLFAFRNGQIDYTQIVGSSANTSISWVAGWKPSSGTSGQTQYLQNNFNVNNSHMAIVTPDGRVNYCDANYIGNFYQNVPALGSNYTGFNPLDSTTYTFTNMTAIVPPSETAQCLAFLNQYLLVGGKGNTIYPWNLSPQDNTYSVPLILLPESNVASMVTVGNLAYVFVGNRGNIYITNGAQASFYKKIPDHLSNTIEPYFYWGGAFTAGVPTATATFNKNRLYFGLQAISQDTQNLINGYGGIWCINLATKALWNSNQLSYGNYNGSVSALLANPGASAGGLVNSYGSTLGYGLIAGWADGGSPQTFGMDASVAAPYHNGESYIVSDLIPVGTALKPNTATQLEFKLVSPLLTGESVQLLVASSLANAASPSFTSAGTTNGSGSELSGNFSIPVQAQQWTLVKAVQTSLGTAPSYVRLKELRIIGATTKLTGISSVQ